jgi:hypothetical protein
MGIDHWNLSRQLQFQSVCVLSEIGTWVSLLLG